MTSTIAPKKSPATSSAPLDTSPVDADTGLSMQDGTIGDINQDQSPAPAATFSSTSSAPPKLPFSPPQPPALVDEKTAKSDDERASIRAKNGALIGQYNRDFRGYQERYTAFVEKAPNLAVATSYGEPVAYNPLAKLPVSQWKSYDKLQDSALATPVDLHKALGDKLMEEKGIEAPSVHAIFEIEVERNGNAGRITTVNGHTKIMGAAGYMGEGGGARVWLDPVGAKNASDLPQALEVRAGDHAVEIGRDGHLAIENDLSFGGHGAKAKIGERTEVNPDKATVTAEGIVGAELHGFAEVKVGYGAEVTLASAEYVKESIDGEGVFAKQLRANIPVGR